MEDWKEPYTAEWAGVFDSYTVVFESTNILRGMSKALAERWAASLNGAYNLGRASIQLEGK